MPDLRSRRTIKTLTSVVVAVLVWLLVWPAALGGSASYVVISGPSMEPAYRTGDLVVARERSSYEAGDVVVFDTGDGQVIHRIVGGDAKSGYVTQGDNNPDPDRWSPTADEVLGEAVLHLPRVGGAVLLAKEVVITPPFPYLLAGFVFLVIVLGDGQKSGSRRRRRPGTRDVDEGLDASKEVPTGVLIDAGR